MTERATRRRFVLQAAACATQFVWLRAGAQLPARPRPKLPALSPFRMRADGDVALWDGASGATGTYFNAGALLPWQHPGGDWIDAAGVAQGSVPFGAITSGTMVGPYETDVTPLVRKWYAGGNSGAYLRASGAAGVALRRHADPAKRPLLLLVDATGAQLEVGCTASAVIDTNTAYAQVGESGTLGDGKHLALQFELPRPEPPFVAARLRVTTTFRYSAPLVLRVHELAPPALFDGGASAQGLAAAYLRDAGIERDPDVYFAGAFDARAFPEGGIAFDSAAAPDPELGALAVHARYRTGNFTACSLNHRWSTKRDALPTRNPHNGLVLREETRSADYRALGHPASPAELYFRYYLKLKAGYQCASQGKKLPGLAGRYGIWTGDDRFGYYNPQTGNGGARTTGDHDGKGFNGWSLRHHAYVAPADANPLRAHVPLNYYAYFVGMPEYFGSYWRWGSAALGYVNLVPERWYCLEHYVRLNTVSEPFDANGNGTAARDGVVRGWVDGVLVFQKTDVALRRHPAIKIDEVWLDHYHGGTDPAEAEHPFAMAAPVVARRYVGPMNRGRSPLPPTTLPAWLRDRQAFEWIAVPGTALADSGALQAQFAAGLCGPAGEPTTYGLPRRGILNFSGGALRTAGSEMLIFGGGGAKAWAGNDVRGLRLDDDFPTWRTVAAPSPVSALWPTTNPLASHPHLQDGTPNARHSYWQPQYIATTDTLMTFGCQNVWESDQGTFNTVDSVPLATGVWRAAGTHPNLPAARGYDGSWVCSDPRTEDVYAATREAVHRFNPAANAWTTVYDNPRANGIERGCAAIDPVRNVLLRIGLSGTQNHQPVTLDLATGQLTAAALTGPHATAIVATWAAGFVFDPLLDRFVLFNDDGYLYTIAWSGPAEWWVERLDLGGTAPDPAHSGDAHSGGTCAIWGRMRYVPRLKGVCIVQAFDRPAYFVRTAP